MYEQRCEYRHRAFANPGSLSKIFNPSTLIRIDMRRCWVEGDDVTEFVSPDGKGTKLYCLFHAHHAPEGWTQGKWDTASLGLIQSARLKELLEQWNAENEKLKTNGEELLVFALPGMQCGNVDFIKYTFSHDIIFDDATFSGYAFFSNATFNGYARFDKAKFSDSAGFDNTTFSADASFSNATFSGSATFFDSTFMKEADFTSSTFNADGNFQRTTFKGTGSFQKAKFHKKALSQIFHLKFFRD